MRLAPLLACSIVCGVAHAQVSPQVRMVARGELPARAISDGEPRALVTVRATGGAFALAALGFDAQPLPAGLAAVRTDAAGLARLLALPQVSEVEERRLLQPLLDQSGPLVGAPAARAETGLDGAGVLVAVIDTGVDFRHPDLRDAAGHTRIAALLDFAVADDGRHPEYGALPGRLWLRDELDAALAAEAAGQTPALPVTERDTFGHGTHVAGIAAGNGLGTGNGLPAGRYVGMAPGADLVIVQASHTAGTFTDQGVLDAATFVLAFAARAGRPLVLNLSLGAVGGPHDGTSHLEQALDAMFPADGAGRVVVVAAGNVGNRDLHAGAWAIAKSTDGAGDGDQVVPLYLSPKSSAPDSSATIELYYDGAIDLSVESPHGNPSPVAAVGKSIASEELTATVNGATVDEGRVLIDNASGGQIANGRRLAGITLVGGAGLSPSDGTWRLHLRGHAARWDAWITGAPAGSTGRFLDRIAVDDHLALPATAHNAISVGSFVSRNAWTTRDGLAITRMTTVGAASAFSSAGPTVDGRFAPDLLAPGDFIASTLSADAPPDQSTTAFFVAGSPTFGWADDGVHALLRGTSQASPHVAGACALLLAADPTLTPARLRELLRTAARPPAAGGFDPREGFGHLDVLAALRLARGQHGATVSKSASVVGVSRDALPPGEALTIVTVTPRDGAGVPLGPGHTVAITLSAGAPAGPVADLGAGRYERPFVAHAPRGAVGTVSATVDGSVLDAHPTVWFVIDRSEIGQPFVAGGGCAQGPARDRTPLAALLAVVILASLVRNSRRRRAGPTL